MRFVLFGKWMCVSVSVIVKFFEYLFDGDKNDQRTDESERDDYLFIYLVLEYLNIPAQR